MKNLFVPLNKEWFDLFADGRKKYELRRQIGGWTPKNVWMGRGVTLSYGYGKKHRLTGMVLDVKTANSVAEIFAGMPYYFINPLADSKEAAIAAAIHTLGQDGPVIAFEPHIDEPRAPECPRCRTDIWCWDGLGDDGSKAECPHCGAPLVVQGSMFDKHLGGQVPRFICDVSMRSPEREADNG